MELSNSLIFGNVYSGPLKASTLAWIRAAFPSGNAWLSTHRLPLCAHRNTIIRDSALPMIAAKEYDWVFFVDHDVTITHPGLEDFLAVDADVVSCNCPMGNEKAWDKPDDFHNHFWRCRPVVLQTIKPPWFAMPTSEDGCDVVGCDCLYFRQKAIAAGFTIAHGGYCGHTNAGTWLGDIVKVK